MRIVRLIPVCALGLLSVSACGTDSSPFGRAASRLPVATAEAAPGPVAVSALAVGCLDSVARDMSLAEGAGIAPAGKRRSPKPQDAGWLPSRIVDLTVTRDGYAVLDAGTGSLTLFSRDFSRRTTVGGLDAQPAALDRFGVAAAVAVDATGDTVWVLDNSPARLIAFDLRGRRVRTLVIPTGGNDLTIGGDGSFYVARLVVPSRVRRDSSSRESPAVAVYDAAGNSKPELLRVTARDLSLPRFNLPGPTTLNVDAAGQYVAVSYLAAGIVDLYRAGVRVGTAAQCVPPQLEARYAEQRAKASDTTRSQSWTPLISDVRIAANGDIEVVSSLQDDEGRYFLHRFTATGRSRGGISIRRGAVHFPQEVGFGLDTNSLVGYRGDGVVVALYLVD